MNDWQDLDPGQAMMVDWTAAEYHADRKCESRSDLWMLSKDPPTYYATVVERSMPRPETKSMDLGTLVHLAVLEPETFMRTVKIKPLPPTCARPAGDAAKFGLVRSDPWAVYDGQCAKMERDGVRLVSADLAKTVTDIAHRVSTHEFASELLALPGVNEQTIIWREPDTGLLCRVRLDSLRDLPDGAKVISDLKSSRTPQPSRFSRSIKDLGYDFQAGFYTDAVRACFPGREVIYAMIVAGNEKPYRVAAAPLAPRAVDRGRMKYKAALADLVRRRETNNWRASWEEDRDLVFDMPNWEYPKAER